MRILKKTLIIIGSLVVVAYLGFLLLPFVLSSLLNNYVPLINEEFNKATGLKSNIEGIKLLTTPKLTIGAGFDKFEILTPDNNKILNANDFEIKMSLLPLLGKNIKIDLVKLKNAEMNLKLNKDGSFEIEKYLPQEDKNDTKTVSNTEALPFGLKLSNNLPDIRLGTCKINFIDGSTGKKYVITGNKTDITDFVFNKSVKIAGDGNMVLDGREQLKYNLKIFNKIMPEENLNDLVFNQQETKSNENQNVNINILDIFKGLYNYKITADLQSDLTVDKNSQNGYLKLENISISPNGIQLPASNAELIFKGNKININSNLYSAQNEASTVAGIVQTGKNTKIDLNVKSGAELNNLVKILNAVAMTFNIKDLQTLSANGKIDADFNIKSDLKKINSSGHLNIPGAQIRYGLYDITIDKINANILLDNNNVNIKNLGFVILNQPLKLYGTISQKAEADLHITANNLSLKGLIIACGQAALLKDNKINSGLVSLSAEVKGKLDKIKPTAKVILSNIDINNVPSAVRLQMPSTDVNIVSDGKTFSGSAQSSNIKAINSVITVSVPKVNAVITGDAIEISQTPVTAGKIKLTVSGKIKNYMKEKIELDFVTSGDIISKLSGDINAVKQTLNLNYATTQDSTIVIPMYDKSKLKFNGNLNITGLMSNPQINGTVNAATVLIPEIPVRIDNVAAKLQGNILNGSAIVNKFVSGGIEADTITTDFSMKGENFYLKNLKGNAFDGKFSGNIIYNMANAKTSVDFKGENMDAEKAIAGAAGIKNALSGTLNFNTKLNLVVYPEYNKLLNSINGNLSFGIKNGAFGTIGRIENLLHASNLLGNAIFKTTIDSLSNIAAVKNSAEFTELTGDMKLSGGQANIAKIKSTGKSLAYYVTGKYNLINNSANVVILGRLDGSIVKLLGPLGDLSVGKIVSLIPKLGDLTAKYAAAVTTNPEEENTKEIPALSSGSTQYKDFKVVFNGGILSASSIKSFKWVSKLDTSAIEQQSIKETVKSLKTNVNIDLNSTVNTLKSIKDTYKEQKAAQKEQFEANKQELKNSVDEIKNLFKF